METHLPTIPADSKPYESILTSTLTSRAKISPGLTNGTHHPASTPKSTRLPGAKPWYEHLTLDLFVYILSRSVFHPAIVLIGYLCLAAIHKHKTDTAYYTLYWAAVLAVIDVVRWADNRVVYGRPRKVEWEKEVVVVTGGAKGLGRAIVERLVGRGAKVAVLDKERLLPTDRETREFVERGDVCWIDVCDVTKAKDVEAAFKRIRNELGAPSILINNAAGPIENLPLIKKSTDKYADYMDPYNAEQTFKTNIFAAYDTLFLFLRGYDSDETRKPSNGATIVTISSVLNHLHPACLAHYSSSKAALSSLHNTLTHEILSHPSPYINTKIKTLLVETGQLDTSLFAKVKTPWYMSFFAPMLDVNDVAKEIERRIEWGDSGTLRMPVYASLVAGPLWGLLPESVRWGIRWVGGVDRALD